ncbi:MAG: DnaA/Hda family protein [Kiloniellaceae bacterium]
MTAPAQLPLELDHRPALGREDFLVTPGNAEAVDRVDRWPDWPAGALALYGPSGSGKSHLCQVWRQTSGAVEIDAEMLRRDEPPAYLGDAQACVVEDVSACLAPEPEIARRLLHLYNMMLERRGYLLLADRRAPARWACPLADLRSRLSAMQAVAVGGPDDVLIDAVLVKLLFDRQLDCRPEVVRYLAPRLERSFTAVRDVVEAIDRAALAAKRRQITVPMARAVMQEIESAKADDRSKGD